MKRIFGEILTRFAFQLLSIGITLVALFCLWAPPARAATYGFFTPNSTLFQLGDTMTLHTSAADVGAGKIVSSSCGATSNITGYRWIFYSKPLGGTLGTLGQMTAPSSTGWYIPSTNGATTTDDLLYKATVSQTVTQYSNSSTVGYDTWGTSAWGCATCNSYALTIRCASGTFTGTTAVNTAWQTVAATGTVSNTNTTSTVNTTSTQYIMDLSFAWPAGIIIFLLAILVMLILLKW